MKKPRSILLFAIFIFILLLLAVSIYKFKVIDSTKKPDKISDFHPSDDTDIAGFPGNVFRYVTSVYVCDLYAYVIDSGFNIQIVDISSCLSPKLIGSFKNEIRIEEICVKGSYLYIADSMGFSGCFDNSPGYISTLKIVDISNPKSPALVGCCGTQGMAQGVCVRGSYAYVADSYGGLQVFDVSNPKKPIIVGSCDGFRADAIQVVGNLAYIAQQWYGATRDEKTRRVRMETSSALIIVDVSNPQQPTIMSKYEVEGWAHDIFVKDSVVYLANGTGLVIIDASNPKKPKYSNFFRTHGKTFGVYIKDSWAYLADAREGLLIIDISNLTNLKPVATYSTSALTWDVFVKNKHAYVADGSGGLRIIKVPDATAPKEQDVLSE